MPSITLVTALALLAAGQCAAETALFSRAVAGKGYLAVPVGTARRPQKMDSGKRASGHAIEVVLQNMEYFYTIELGMGTPPQRVTVLVDTGSSELWVNPDCSSTPTIAQERQCKSFGRYDYRKSETPPVGPEGSEKINYGDPTDESTQTSVSIDYFRDTVSFGPAEVKNQTFGVVSESRGIAQGILGLAPDLRAGFNGTRNSYSLVLNSMADQGFIASRVFSLDLRHAESETGAVIYGGLDRDKFVGSLETLPLVRGIQGEFRLAVDLVSLGVTQHVSAGFDLTGANTNFMLDSGTTLSRMHRATALPILNALDAKTDGEGFYYVPCAMRKAQGTVDFGFADKTIRVPFSDFILGDDTASDRDFCYVGLVVTKDQQILGDSVLRAGYFVFDWDNQEVHVAQAATCGDSDIVAVGSGKDSVPNVEGNCKEVKGAPSATRSGNHPTTTVYTVTSCPTTDSQCETGRVTTQTIQPTATGSANGDENAGAQPQALGWIFSVFGALAVVYNVL